MNKNARRVTLKAERHDFKRWLVGLFGGKCERCGWTPKMGEEVALDFHHRDPSTKLFSFGGSLTRSREAVLIEAAKCDLLCANCHRIVESKAK